ncbi:MAG TPA: hypothetical protein VLV47_00180 [Candidatus Bathyarchaeia archaeon]|nr:hypothetical protein [Candidatus Bathyarchaeia archaeon]
MKARRCCVLLLLLLLAVAAVAQQTQLQASQPSSQQDAQGTSPDEPMANPARPTVATPATLTPVGYLQFETGVLNATGSPGLSSQFSLNELIKYSFSRWLQVLAASEPYAHSRDQGLSSDAAGDVDVGVQAVVHPGEGANPTVALSYLGRAYAGAAPDLDIASFKNRALVLVSADVKGFHYDANALFDELLDNGVRRAAFGQTLSVSHKLVGDFGLTGEIWHFTQPFLRSNAVGNLWVLTYNASKILVLDCGFDHGLTSTSTQWEAFAGFTYLLPRRLPLRLGH